MRETKTMAANKMEKHTNINSSYLDSTFLLNTRFNLKPRQTYPIVRKNFYLV